MAKESKNVYIGNRYVPLLTGEWDKTQPYEGLTIVTYQGDSYTSKKNVPIGIDITNEEYWVVTGNYNAQIENYRREVREMGDYVDTEVDKLNDELNIIGNDVNQAISDLQGRGVNLKSLGASLNGEDDDYDILMSALQTYKHVVIPVGSVLATTKPIIVGQGMSLEGAVPNTRGYYKSPVIKYIGTRNDRESLITIGRNRVGEEPTGSSDNVVFRNFLVDCNNMIGYGVYSTYITNETLIDNITITGSLEYNGYFAKAWYATITNITSLKCRGKGLSFGIPITYQNGQSINWTSSAPYEMNNIKIDNIRSHRSGEFFSQENPNTFDPTNPNHINQGYGIGLGIGNGFTTTNFTSEMSGGVNLYVYTSSQPSKTIRQGYLERSCFNSGLNNNEMCNMLIHHIHRTGGKYEIGDIYFHPNSGGIYFKGDNRQVQLRNLYQPQFLRSLDGLSSYELYKIVLKDNVYYMCGYCNTNEKGGRVIYETVNTRYSFNVGIPLIEGSFNMLFLKSTSGSTPIGGYRIIDNEGNSNAYDFPESLPTDEYIFIRFFTGSAVQIVKAGVDDEINSEVDFRILTVPTTV